MFQKARCSSSRLSCQVCCQIACCRRWNEIGERLSMTSQMAGNVSGGTTSTVCAYAYRSTPSYTSNGNKYLCQWWPERPQLSTYYFGSSLSRVFQLSLVSWKLMAFPRSLAVLCCQHMCCSWNVSGFDVILSTAIKIEKYNRKLGRFIIIKSKCLITEEQQEISAQSESQEESRQATLTHTELSIAVCPFTILTDPFVYRSRPSWPRTSSDPQDNQPLWWIIRIRRDKNFQGSSTPTTKSAHSAFQARWLWLVGEGIKPWAPNKRKVQTPPKRGWILPILQTDRLLGQTPFDRWKHCREVKWVWMARMVQRP